MVGHEPLVAILRQDRDTIFRFDPEINESCRRPIRLPHQTLALSFLQFQNPRFKLHRCVPFLADSELTR